MKVKDLKALLADIPDDMDVVTPGFDEHRVSLACAEVTEVVYLDKKLYALKNFDGLSISQEFDWMDDEEIEKLTSEKALLINFS